jgi:hypothetical protein
MSCATVGAASLTIVAGIVAGIVAVAVAVAVAVMAMLGSSNTTCGPSSGGVLPVAR